jgi:hypothetical protein
MTAVILREQMLFSHVVTFSQSEKLHYLIYLYFVRIGFKKASDDTFDDK